MCLETEPLCKNFEENNHIKPKSEVILHHYDDINEN